MFGEHFLPTDNIVLDQNCLVIDTGDRMVLFDTGMASAKRANTHTGRLIISLAQAGIDPKDIDAVVLTHPHVDHSGGMVADDGSRNFPNAQVYLTQADFDFWLDDARLGTRAEGSALIARKNLPPYRDRIVFIRDGQEILPGVQAMADAGTHGRPHRLPDHFRRQDDLQHRRRRSPPDPVRASQDRGQFRHRFQAGRGLAREALRHAGGAAHSASGISHAVAWARPSGQARRRFPLRAGADATGAVNLLRQQSLMLVFAPSPCEGEGKAVCQRGTNGRVVGRLPHSGIVAHTELPSPCRERAQQ